MRRSGARLSHEPGGTQSGIFNFEVFDSGLEGATNGSRPNEQTRLSRLGNQLRDHLAKSGRVDGVDIAAVAAKARAAYLATRDGCEI